MSSAVRALRREFVAVALLRFDKRVCEPSRPVRLEQSAGCLIQIFSNLQSCHPCGFLGKAFQCAQRTIYSLSDLLGFHSSKLEMTGGIVPFVFSVSGAKRFYVVHARRCWPTSNLEDRTALRGCDICRFPLLAFSSHSFFQPHNSLSAQHPSSCSPHAAS